MVVGAYLLRSPKNAKRLLEAIADLQRGRGTERELADSVLIAQLRYRY